MLHPMADGSHARLLHAVDQIILYCFLARIILIITAATIGEALIVVIIIIIATSGAELGDYRLCACGCRRREETDRQTDVMK